MHREIELNSMVEKIGDQIYYDVLKWSRKFVDNRPMPPEFGVVHEMFPSEPIGSLAHCKMNTFLIRKMWDYDL